MKLSPCPAENILHKLPSGGRVLEIGCGDGELLAALKRAGGRSLSACEPDPVRAAAARAATGIEVIQAGAESLPYPENSFDAAVMECVFSLCAPEQAVAELSRVLVPGGTALVADLFSEGAQTVLQDSPQIKNIYSKSRLEQYFLPCFALDGFEDYTRDLRAMFAQMLMQGACCSCISRNELPLLRAAKPGYGLWTWTKR